MVKIANIVDEFTSGLVSELRNRNELHRTGLALGEPVRRVLHRPDA
jgi:hypothetical protein